MARISLVEKKDLPKSYKVLEDKKDNLPDGVDAAFWNCQPTVRAFSNNPELGRAHVTMNTLLWTETNLRDSEEECIILIVANKLNCRLLWHEHVMLSLKNDRLSMSDISNIGSYKIGELNSSIQIIAEYVLEFIDNNGDVSEKTHNLLSKKYEDSSIVSIVKLTGFYIGLSHEVNALRIDNDLFVGWKIENYDEVKGNK